jgi:hypothetical protein
MVSAGKRESRILACGRPLPAQLDPTSEMPNRFCGTPTPSKSAFGIGPHKRSCRRLAEQSATRRFEDTQVRCQACIHSEPQMLLAANVAFGRLH